MNAALKLAAFAAVLALLAGGGAIAGATLGPDRDSAERPKMAGHGEDGGTATAETSHGENGATATAQSGHDEDGGAHGEADAVRGLATAQDGLRLELRTPELRRGADERLVFAITGDDGRPVENLDVTHTKRMHVIVVRRDLTGFQHVHPSRRPTAPGRLRCAWMPPARTASSPTSPTTARRARWPATCASTVPPTCVPSPSRPPPRAPRTATTSS
ncbi:MAG: hypothetical protein R2736_21425 [Solirubrobacterales bacterium]